MNDDLNSKNVRPTDISQSITEEIYKKNLELLRERKRTEQLLYGVSEAVFSVDSDYKITVFNRAAEKMMGISSLEAVGKNADEIVHLQKENGQKIPAADFCFKGNQEFMSPDIAVLKSSNGNFYITVKSSETGDDTAKECIITLTDFTRERFLEKTKDDFISVTSHELRTPITIIKSYLWMLENGKGGELNETQKTYLQKAIIGTERLLNLIHDTLNIARIEQHRIEIRIEKTDIKQLIEEMTNELKIKADEKNIWLKTEYIEPVSYVYTDRNKMREVFINLVGNSIKFTNTGGITIKTEPFENTHVKISIIDTGKGIDKNDIEKLFHKFGRLDNSYQTIAEAGGTGLGLFIVKSLIETMGGQVGATSEGLEKGSTFWFTMPIKEPIIQHADQSEAVKQTTADKDSGLLKNALQESMANTKTPKPAAAESITQLVPTKTKNNSSQVNTII